MRIRRCETKGVLIIPVIVWQESTEHTYRKRFPNIIIFQRSNISVNLEKNFNFILNSLTFSRISYKIVIYWYKFQCELPIIYRFNIDYTQMIRSMCVKLPLPYFSRGLSQRIEPLRESLVTRNDLWVICKKWNKNRNSAARESICSRYLPLISQCGCLKNQCGKFSVMMLIHIIYVVHRETCLASPTNRRRFVRRNATCISRNCLRNCRFENVCVHIYVRIKRCRLAWEKLFDCNCTAQRMLDESIFACYNVGQR